MVGGVTLAGGGGVVGSFGMYVHTPGTTCKLTILGATLSEQVLRGLCRVCPSLHFIRIQMSNDNYIVQLLYVVVRILSMHV